MTITVDPDCIASLVQREFNTLPAKRKPAVRGNGILEWVPLSGIVAQGMKCLPSSKLPQAHGNVLHDWHAEVLAIRTFNRFVLEECRQLSLGGPDMTSPFLRRRTAEEISRCSGNGIFNSTSSSSSNTGSGSRSESYSTWHVQPFAWREDVALHMYCSEAPCGDASMELTMAAQTDASPWDIPPSPPSTILPTLPTPTTEPHPTIIPTPHPSIPIASDITQALPGRAFFSLLGAVRRKPARGDAPPTLSKACSDKLALRQCTSLLAGTTALLVSPEDVYLSTLILPTSQFSDVGCRRAFSGGGGGDGDGGGGGGGGEEGREEGGRVGKGGGRMRSLNTCKWAGGYAFRPFEVRTTDVEFAFSRREVARRAAAAAATAAGNKKSKTAASNIAVAWTAAPTPTPTSKKEKGLEETTLGGTLQGHRRRLSNSDEDVRGASFASRRQLWGLAAEVAAAVAATSTTTTTTIEIQHVLNGGSGDADTGASSEERKKRTYGEVKGCGLLTPRRRVKEEVWAEALKGWARNEGDDGFSL